MSLFSELGFNAKELRIDFSKILHKNLNSKQNTAVCTLHIMHFQEHFDIVCLNLVLDLTGGQKAHVSCWSAHQHDTHALTLVIPGTLRD